MLTPRAGAVRDWVLFALAALAPAIAVGLLGVRALRNEEAAARREIALGLDASAERVVGTVKRAVGASRADLSRAPLEGDTRAIASALRSIAPAFATPIVLGSDRALLEPAPPGAPPMAAPSPARCGDLARAIASSPTDHDRAEARRDLLDHCEEARSATGRWLWPVAALNPASSDRGDAIARWFESHASLLGAAEREARRHEVMSASDLDASIRDRITRAMTATTAGRDELIAALKTDAAAAALRGGADASGLLAWDGASVGALRPLSDGRLAGFIVDRASLAASLDAGWAPISTGQRASIATGRDRASSRASAEPDLVAIAKIGEDLAIAIEPANPRAATALAARSRALLVGIAIGSLAIAFGVAAALFARMRAARRASALRIDFVGAVSHELRTPIASVRMLAELLDEGRVENEERAEVYAALSREARRLGETVDRLLGFSRMAAGRYKVTPEVGDVCAAVAASIDTFEERSPDLPRVARDLDVALRAPIDSGEIRLAVDNLLANAKKYAPTGSPYRVRVAREDGGVVIEVSDRGPGIARRDQRRIFEPFERVDDRLSRATEGSGIGLSLVRHVARAHGGRVRVESEPGRGAAFTIWIPGERRST